MKQIIEKYQTIIIHRHLNPDCDAYGSQLGLKEILKENYPDKQIYAVGDSNKYRFLGEMDEITDEAYQESLVIITDVAVSQLVSDKRYLLAKEVIVIDHHNNSSDITGEKFVDTSYSSASELVTDLCLKAGYKVNKAAATPLLCGIITDTGRFFYPSITQNTFKTASFLLEKGALLQWIYDHLYIEDLESKKMKAYFTNTFQITKHNVAYLMNDETIYDRFDVDTFTISRGMVNVMSGIKDINIWANFTVDRETKKVMAELRSKGVNIVDIAKSFGGGGHNQACGATLNSFDEAEEMLSKLDQLSKEVFYDTK